jgi:hypothetical protein
MKTQVLGLLAALVGVVPTARAVLEFSGYLASNGERRFLVTELDRGQTSGWLRIGDSFEGHTVARFEAQDEVLVVEHAGTSLRLPLKASRVKPVPRSSGEVDDAVARIIAARFDNDRAKFLAYLRNRGIGIREYRREVEAVVRGETLAPESSQAPNRAPEVTPPSISPPLHPPRQP